MSGLDALQHSELRQARVCCLFQRAEFEVYDHLPSGAVSTSEADSLEKLDTLLIKACIAHGRSQRHLAEQLGIAERQIQRYEATGYRPASLAQSARSPAPWARLSSNDCPYPARGVA